MSKPRELLKEEVDRFFKTNTFTPMEVTNFYAQAKCVIQEIETLTAKAKRYEEALKFYADILSWTHLKGENDFPWGRPVILYDDCGHVYPDNEWCSYGGKRARAALNQGES